MLNRRKLLKQTSRGAGAVGFTQLFLPHFLAGSARAATPTLPGIPTPDSVIGFKIGTDYKLANYRQAVAYLHALAAASPMIKLLELGKTSGGNTMICAVISSAENIKSLDRYKEISRRLTLTEGVSDDEARALAKEGRTIVYIDGGLHASEVAPAQHNIQLAYELVTNDDPGTRKIRENTILLLNFANPDGMNIVPDWYMKNVGTPYQTSPVPVLWHVYAGHDNNRDSYMLNLNETRMIQALQFKEWFPVIQINHHQSAPFPTRISIPPLPEPLNPNIHPLLTRWKNVLGSTMGAAFDRNNQPGAISRIVIDGWAPEMLDSVGDLFQTMSCSPETAGNEYAEPHLYKLEEIPQEYKDFTPSIFYPNPWKGGWWRLKDAVDYVTTCSMAALYTAATFREEMLFDKYRMGKDTITRFSKDAPFAWLIPQDQWDPPVAALMLNRMIATGIKVCAAQQPFQHGNKAYPKGTWVIPMQHAFAEFVKSIFEEQRYPDLANYPALWQGVVFPQKFPNAYLPPYDTAGWTVPYQMGVDVIPARSMLKADLAPIETASARHGTVSLASASTIVLSAKTNNSFIAVSRLLKAGAKVGRATKPILAGGNTLPPGSWIVRPPRNSRTMLDTLARDLCIDVIGLPKLAGIDGFAISAPRVGLYQSWVPSMDEGWTRYLFEQYEVPFKRVIDAEIRAGALGSKYDVLVIPDNGVDAIIDGHKAGTIPPEYVGGITETGLSNISAFVEKGGSLVLLNDACSLALEKFDLPVKDALAGLRPERHSDFSEAPPKSSEVKFACPSSLLHIAFNPAHPLAFGMPENGTAQFANSFAFDVLNDFGSRKSAVVAHYPAGDLLRSGFLRGGEYLNSKAAAVEVAMGKGRVILYGFGVQRRAQPHQTFKLLFNAIYQSASQATNNLGKALI